MVPAARHFGLGVLPYFPLANGLLTGKVRRGQAPPAGSRLAGRPGYVDRRQARPGRGADRVGGRAAGVTVLEVAIGGLAAQPGCAWSSPGRPRPSRSRPTPPPRSGYPTAEDLADLDRVVPPPSRR